MMVQQVIWDRLIAKRQNLGYRIAKFEREQAMKERRQAKVVRTISSIAKQIAENHGEHIHGEALECLLLLRDAHVPATRAGVIAVVVRGNVPLRTVILSFTLHATDWRGAEARKLKSELKAIAS